MVPLWSLLYKTVEDLLGWEVLLRGDLNVLTLKKSDPLLQCTTRLNK